jgi:hypothetical protein
VSFDFKLTFFHELLGSWLGFFSFDMIQLTSVECQWKMSAGMRLLMELVFFLGLAIPPFVGWLAASMAIAVVKAEETEDDEDVWGESNSPTKQSCGSQAALCCLQILRSKPIQQFVPPTPTKKKPSLAHLSSRKRIEIRIPLRKHVKERCTQLLIAMYMLLYEPTVSRFAEAFNCPGGYLSLDPTLECVLSNSRYQPLFAVGCVCIVLVNVLPLLGFAYALRVESTTGAMDLNLLQDHTPAQVRCFKRYGTLFMPFEPKYFYWQLLIMLRKLLLALVVKCGTGSPSMQFALGSLVLSGALGAQRWCQPFLIQDQDDLEQIELAASIIVLLVVGTNDQLSSDLNLTPTSTATNLTLGNLTINGTSLNSTSVERADAEEKPYMLASAICVCIVCISIVWIIRKIWGIGAAAELLAEKKLQLAKEKLNRTHRATAGCGDGETTIERDLAADAAPIQKDELEVQLDFTEQA